MRAVVIALSLFAGQTALAQPQPSATTAAQPAKNPNVVLLSTASPWWGNSEFDRKVTLVINSVDLDAAVDALGRSASISLIASGGTKARKKVTLNLREAPLRDVMLALANLYGLTWFRTGEVYTLTYVSASRITSGPSLRQPTIQPLAPLRAPRTRTYRRRLP